MFKNFIRFKSAIPFEPVPINQFKGRSNFNFKPKKTPGLIHNPPSSINKPSIKTPRAFLPKNDPRRSLPVKTFTKEELADYPLVQDYQAQTNRTYDITPEVVQQIQQLRQENPQEWTISKLSKKFDLPMNKINTLSGSLETPKILQMTERQQLKVMNRKKRSELWLRGEF